MTIYTNDSGKKVNPNYVPPTSTVKCLNPLERNELEKAMLGRGVDYETIQLILKDFDIRIEHLYQIYESTRETYVTDNDDIIYGNYIPDEYGY